MYPLLPVESHILRFCGIKQDLQTMKRAVLVILGLYWDNGKWENQMETTI